MGETVKAEQLEGRICSERLPSLCVGAVVRARVTARKNRGPEGPPGFSKGDRMNRLEDYFLKPFTFLEGAEEEEAGLVSLAQAPRPKATATRVMKAMFFIVL